MKHCVLCNKEGNDDEIVLGTCEECHTAMIDANVECCIKKNEEFKEVIEVMFGDK